MVSQEEAQKLINISLGKIASYRSQRGSSNLHKNVLVANVLRRVRNTALEEPPFCQVSDMTSSVGLTSENECVKCTDEGFDVKPNDVLDRLAVRCDDVTMSHGDSDVCNFQVEGCQEEDESPNDATDLSTTHSIDEIERKENNFKRTRSLKRSCVTSDDCISVKRRRDCSTDELMRWRVARRLSTSECDGDSETESDLVSDQEFHTLDSKDSPMDVEQICGLVSVFRSSFQGLGYLGSATSEQVSCRDTSSYPTKVESRQNSSLRRGLSLPDLCAKQAVDELARQSFKMCTPALALTV